MFRKLMAMSRHLVRANIFWVAFSGLSNWAHWELRSIDGPSLMAAKSDYFYWFARVRLTLSSLPKFATFFVTSSDSHWKANRTKLFQINLEFSITKVSMSLHKSLFMAHDSWLDFCNLKLLTSQTKRQAGHKRESSVSDSLKFRV